MKVLCLCFWFYDYTIQFANALSRRCTVMLLIPDTVSQEYLNLIDEQIEVQQFEYYRSSSGGFFSIFPMIRTIIRQARAFNPDIIHYQAHNPVLCAILPFLRSYPQVATIHDVKPHPGEDSIFHRGAVPQKILLYYSRKYSDKIFVHGEYLKKEMMENYSVRGEIVHAIPMGEHEVEPFTRYWNEHLPEDAGTILFFGRIYAYKGLDCLIKAEPFITKEVPDAKIIIAGVGEDFSKYEKMMVNRERFIIHNYLIPYAEGAALFQRSSVVVLPYKEASQSGVITTAYGFGKPVIVTDVGSIPEMVDEGKTGFIVPPRDPEALAGAIVTLLKNNEQRKMMGENGLKKLKTDLSWETIVETAIFPVYEQALPKRVSG
ncbi:glycosyltransferase family 4 protein [Methanogenium sp. S4BF]|uniref:glycosyltransferase family 4 protein n=1 Tax=Methanogenium sp. S4BF TaxID=1789226 RepID=UPI002415B4E0|nr:glycosyltransferase family 4 protein [Methanogenium sp. S4BF]WFN35319.1 glycosyltransferase family 4 protein [Methanogenium sp. S4BF]